MQAEVGNRLVLHGKQGTRIGVVTEVTGAGWVVRWADSPDAQSTWEAAKAAPSVAWRPGITAGVGREASLAQAAQAAQATVAHEVASGE